MRKLIFITWLVVCGLLVSSAAAETFKLSNGETIIGELLLSSVKDEGVQIKVDEGKYEKVPWASFSQEDLKKFAQNPKLQPFVEPFIEISQEERIKKTEVKVEQPPRLERPAKRFVLGAMFSSGLGIFILVALYGTNLYAGYEVAVFRAQPPLKVCGLSAVLPIIGPIIFLSMPTRLSSAEPAVEVPPGEMLAAEAADDTVNPMLADGAEHPTGLKLHAEEAEGQKPAVQATTTYQRGQFTFNRRFFETKFPGFFGVIKRDAEKDMVLVIKAARGEFVADRITRIAANDLHVQVHKGHASEEVMIPFTEIQQIQLKHRAA